ncbi:MAG: hypothetical protein GY820_18965 [Gammaproteobacteria bacterium]|nr:hypothetical protein [Gammaproteobacteria bacterium]
MEQPNKFETKSVTIKLKIPEGTALNDQFLLGFIHLLSVLRKMKATHKLAVLQYKSHVMLILLRDGSTLPVEAGMYCAFTHVTLGQLKGVKCGCVNAKGDLLTGDTMGCMMMAVTIGINMIC